MALRDPFAVYDAANNLEAMLVSEMLQAAGIEAYTVEDLSPVGTWMFGLLPEIHKPQVWIERADTERVKPLLEEYERLAVAKRQTVNAESTIEVICEECEKPSMFSVSRIGSVETCPYCGAYVDVGDAGGFDGWDVDGDAEQEES